MVDRRPLTDSLTPDEVCAELDRLRQALRAHEAEYGDADATEIADQVDQLFDDVETLPSRDVARARGVYAALAESEHRDFAAMLMPELTEADPEFALPLWLNLIGDADPTVRSLAYDALTMSAPQRPGLQLDFRQVLPLFDAYLAAEKGGRP